MFTDVDALNAMGGRRLEGGRGVVGMKALYFILGPSLLFLQNLIPIHKAVYRVDSFCKKRKNILMKKTESFIRTKFRINF